MDAPHGRWKKHIEKKKLYKNASNYIELILVATPFEIIAIRPLTFYLTRQEGYCWRSKDEIISDVLQWTTHVDGAELTDQQELTYTSSVRAQNVV